MNELRKDYILDRYVIISTSRAKRPHQFKSEPEKMSDASVCPFCRHNESMIPAIVSDDKQKGVRVVKNKFAATMPEGDARIRTDNRFFTFASAFGTHEVIIETDKHGQEFAEMDRENIKTILDSYIWRIKELSKIDGIKYVSVFKNSGDEAGASISHAHSQVIAYNLVPRVVVDYEIAFKKYHDVNKSCAFCDLMQTEKQSDRRIIENESFTAFCPYASRFNFEVMFLPKRHLKSITDLSMVEVYDLADILKYVISRLNTLGYPDYNLEIVYGYDEIFHFSVSLTPRLAKWAGFELETETIINVVTPEDAAKFYRGEE